SLRVWRLAVCSFIHTARRSPSCFLRIAGMVLLLLGLMSGSLRASLRLGSMGFAIPPSEAQVIELQEEVDSPLVRFARVTVKSARNSRRAAYRTRERRCSLQGRTKLEPPGDLMRRDAVRAFSCLSGTVLKYVSLSLSTVALLWLVIESW